MSAAPLRPPSGSGSTPLLSEPSTGASSMGTCPTGGAVQGRAAADKPISEPELELFLQETFNQRRGRCADTELSGAVSASRPARAITKMLRVTAGRN